MRYRSTRQSVGGERVSFAVAVERGLAPDGGLYVPETLPEVAAGAQGDGEDLPAFAVRLLRPFLAGDVLAPALEAMCRAALDFSIPLVDLAPGTAMLELFHGPTAAFKDVGARFLAECMTRLPGERCVLVATSGDTGGAVAAAFWRKPGVRVVVLFPERGVSARQRQQLTCWGDNVRAFAVRGVFDDCQRLVKAMFADRELVAELGLTSANSINVGRLLPQVVYHARAALCYARRHDRAAGAIVPTGNLGNALAALWAMAIGFPVREVVFATNANRAVPELLRTGTYRARQTVQTLANAMDVGAPSNVERLLDLLPDIEALRSRTRAVAVDDDAIRATIAAGEARWGRVMCPHTATAMWAREQLGGDDWIVAATAHPAKFETIVEPLVGHEVPVPPSLASLLERESHCQTIDADVAELKRRIA